MGDRYIRLKEWGISIDTTKQPKIEQIKQSDGTLLDKPFRLRTNSEGFIYSGNDLPDLGGRVKITLLGGSFVESLYADETDRFASQLERQMVNRWNLEVWNGGYSGATLLHSFNIFVNKIIPHLGYTEELLIFTAMSDQRTLVHTDSYWVPDPTHAPVIDERNKPVTGNREATSKDQRRLLGAFRSVALGYGIDPILVTSPFRHAKFEDDVFSQRLYGSKDNHELAMAKLHMINDEARSFARSQSAPLFDLAAHIDGNPAYFYDDMHLNHLGQKAVADFLEEKLHDHMFSKLL